MQDPTSHSPRLACRYRLPTPAWFRCYCTPSGSKCAAVARASTGLVAAGQMHAPRLPGPQAPACSLSGRHRHRRRPACPGALPCSPPVGRRCHSQTQCSAGAAFRQRRRRLLLRRVRMTGGASRAKGLAACARRRCHRGVALARMAAPAPPPTWTLLAGRAAAAAVAG